MSPRSSGTDVQLGRIRLPLADTTPRVARNLVAEIARCWALDSILDQVRLAVSELATNAWLHTSTAIPATLIIEVARVGKFFHVTIQDGSGTPPQPRTPADTEETGRGLLLVTELTDACDWYLTPFGKAVYFEIATDWPLDLAT